ncbi:MAG: ATP-binding protein [Catenulispora sp.]
MAVRGADKESAAGTGGGADTGSAAGSRTPESTALYWSFPGTALDVSLSRRWLAAAVEALWGAGDDADRVVLAYSEVATNAVVHGRGPVTVSARIRVSSASCDVADCSARTPQLHHAELDDVGGRGMELVVSSVDRLRVIADEAGKTVSFEVGRHREGEAESGGSPVRDTGPEPVGEMPAGSVGHASGSGPAVPEPGPENDPDDARGRSGAVPRSGRYHRPAIVKSSVGGPAGGPVDGSPLRFRPGSAVC